MKILYLEDNEDAVANFRRITTFYKHHLLVADSVKVGLSMLDEHPNLVLADMLLADGNAITFTEVAREQYPALPIIILTGYANPGEREACFAAGCTDYFIKPIGVNTLIDLFRRYQENGIK